MHWIEAIAASPDSRLGEYARVIRPKSARRGAMAVVAALFLAATLPGHACAQMIAGSGPLNISSDHSELVQNGKELIFRGRVEAVRGASRLRCDTLQIFIRPKAASPKAQAQAQAKDSGPLDTGNIDRIVAEGDVYMVTGDDVVRGDMAVYTAADDTIVVTGKQVILKRGEDVGLGTRLVVQRTKGLATLEGGQAGRPRMIVFPKQSPAGGPPPSSSR